MFIEWWNGLGTLLQVFYCIAIPATLVLLIQTVMMLIGMGDDGDVDGIGDGDVGDADLDVDTDGTDGVFGDGDLDDVADVAGLEG